MRWECRVCFCHVTAVGIQGFLKHKAPASRVRKLMEDLLKWLSKTDVHPIIASAVFHYEFEFIHPFADGNGRIGRLWQSLILSNWNPIFTYLPIESLIYKNQEKYYDSIKTSTDNAECSVFIEFMLEMIVQSLHELTPLLTT